MNFIIPTLILWVTNAFLVIPLANKWASKQLCLASSAGVKTLSEETKKSIEKEFIRKYILLDVMILGAIGIIAGLMGYFFIGVSFEKKGWPGMIAFILMSLIGFSIKGGAV
ncbi:MAG: hypothetical protein WC546_03600 [Candidatus Omnitrophota bacterium]